MIILHIAHSTSGAVIYVPVEQIKVISQRSMGTSVIVEGNDDLSPWIVSETPTEIAKLMQAWRQRALFSTEALREGASIVAIGLNPETKGLVPEYAVLHLETVH